MWLLKKELMSKKLLQPSMMDKGFLTHYMICKYIDDLPNSWCTEDLTNATGDVTAVGNESTLDTDLRNEHAFSAKCLNENSETASSTTETDENSTEAKHETTRCKFTLNDVFFEHSQLHAANASYNRTDSTCANIITHPKTSVNKEHEMINADKETNFTPSKIHEEQVTKQRLSQGPMPINSSSTTGPNIHDSSLFMNSKKLYSNSSKSHSRIALFDENNDDDDDLEDDLMQNKVKTSAVESPMAMKSMDTDIFKSSINAQIMPQHANQQISVYSASSQASAPQHTTYTKLTKEALAKHTRDQDEQYIIDIMRQSNVAGAPKRVSENPQNIFALAPNVFSRNDYEPALVKKRKVEAEKAEKTAEKKAVDEHVSEADVKIQTAKQLGASYSNEINEIDFDNPQLYHEIFTKNPNIKHTAEKQAIKSKPEETKSSAKQIKREESKEEKKTMKMEVKDPGAETISELMSSSNTPPSNSSNSNNTDFIKFWKKFIKQGSAVVKNLEECETLLKNIIKISKKQQNDDFSQKSCSQPNTSSISVQESLKNKVKRLKKALCSIADLLSINFSNGIEKSQLDLNKDEILDSCIKKIYQYLLKNSLSRYLNFYMTKIVPFTSLKVDLNSVEFLQSLYRDIKQLFMDKFERFNKEKQNVSDAPAILQSSHELLSSFFGGDCSGGNGGESSIEVTTENADDERKSSSPDTGHYERLLSSNKSSKSTSNNNTGNNINNASPNEFDMDTNDFDDTSTYLFDSPTSSFQSGDNISSNNDKRPNSGGSNKPGGNETKHSAKKRSQKNAQNRINIDEESSKSGKTESSDTNKNSSNDTKDKNSSESSKKSSSIEFDDKLCSKLMQNFMDLIKNKREAGGEGKTLPNAADMTWNSKRPCSLELGEQQAKKRSDHDAQRKTAVGQTSIEEQSQPTDSDTTNPSIKRDLSSTIESVSNEDSKSKSPPLGNDKPTIVVDSDENRIEDECIKQLNLNIYNDCLKYLSKFHKSSGDLESE